MRILTFALAGLLLRGQALPVSLIDSDAVRKAVAPLQQWLGAPLVVFADSALVPEPGSGEAFLTNGIIYVPLSRILSFRSPADVAKFLSHAAAHNKLNHAAVFSEKMRAFEQAAVLSPHFPRASMEAAMRAGLEKEAEPVAAEFLAKSACTPRACDLFEDLLDAVRK
jgi:hypothetical protein